FHLNRALRLLYSSSSGGYTAAYMEAGVRDDLLWRLEEDRQHQMLYQHYRESIPRPRPRRYIHRSRAASHNQLWDDYFSPTPTYPAEFFRRRFQMQNELFLRITAAVENTNSYFVQRPDATGPARVIT